MLKTYLYLPEDLNNQINALVKSQKSSKAEVIRLILREGIAEVNRQKAGGAEALLELAKIGKRANAKGPKDLSSNIDTYLWDKYED